MDNGEHDRHLDENADDGGQRRARLESEQGDRRCDGQLEEVARANQRRGTGGAPLDAEGAVEKVGQARI
jgi:hypothetical protein